MAKQIRIVFMGTPEFALPTLEALSDRYAVVGVVTQPDRTSGRGRLLRPPPVKQAALARGLGLFQAQSLRNPEAIAHLRKWAPDVFVTVATGHILSSEVLALPTFGTLNVHASLLPRWRGAAPIQAAILAGDSETGITIMCTDEGLDTGPILSQRAIAIEARETAVSLHDRLALLGAELLLETMPRWLSGDLVPRAQPASGVSVAKRLSKGDGRIDWEETAVEIDRLVRACTPWPSAFTFFGTKRLKVVTASAVPSLAGAGAMEAASGPGSVIELNDSPVVKTGGGLLCLDRVQLEGKRVVSGTEFIRGRPDFLGTTLDMRKTTP